MNIREARVEDAPAMGRLMVTTWLAAHRSHIPPAAWAKRRDEWTPEVSAAGWERHLRARDASPGQSRDCYLVAEDGDGTIIAVAAGAASGSDPTGPVGEVGSLYVNPEQQRRGIGRRLVQQLAACLARKEFRSMHIAVLTANLTPADSTRRSVGSPLGSGSSMKAVYSSRSGSTPGQTSPACWIRRERLCQPSRRPRFAASLIHGLEATAARWVS